jgi:hypothetical protein
MSLNLMPLLKMPEEQKSQEQSCSMLHFETNEVFAE